MDSTEDEENWSCYEVDNSVEEESSWDYMPVQYSGIISHKVGYPNSPMDLVQVKVDQEAVNQGAHCLMKILPSCCVLNVGDPDQPWGEAFPWHAGDVRHTGHARSCRWQGTIGPACP